MQSSFLVTLRALVMLGCLVAVPLWAVFSTALPAKLISYFGGQARPASEARAGTAPTHGSLPDAPAFQPAAVTSPMGPASTGNPTTSPGNLTASPPRNLSPTGAAPQPQAQPIPHGPQTADDLPLEPRANDANRRASFETPARDVANVAALPPRDQFAGLERRLRELGAAYYRLETWGDNGELYRFHCEMAIAGNPAATQHFEATERDALQAMGRVVQQVEDWRTGGRMR